MKYIITGVNGQLGHDVVLELLSRGVLEKDIHGLDINDMDITNRDNVFEVFKEIEPDVVIHCAAFTKVDRAEEESNLCYNVNTLGTRNIVEAARSFDSKMVYISTDYVFDGTKSIPYKEDDLTNPLSVYGDTKLKGELVTKNYPKHFIFRTAWVFGINGNNFIKTMLKLSDAHDTVTVVNDQVGSPTYTKDLARLICDAVETEKYGVYHATNEGFTSWADFAKYIFEVGGKETKVIPVTTEEYVKKMPQQVARPKMSMLSKDKLADAGFKRLPSWKDATDRYIEELKTLEKSQKNTEKKTNVRKR